MDTFCLHRMVESVRDSLSRAGLDGFRLWRVNQPSSWFSLHQLLDYVGRRRHRELPVWLDDRPSPVFDTRGVYLRERRRIIWRADTEGAIFVVGDCLLTVFSLIRAFGNWEEVVIAGERRPGAFQKLLDAYARHELRQTRDSGWIEVIGGAWIPRPAGLAWDDVILPPDLRDDVRLQIESFFSAGPLYRRLGIPHRRGLLFTGPPGNGKTSILRVIASRRKEPFVWMTGSPDEEDDRLDRAIDRAVVLAPSILCLEDIDSLLKGEGALSHFLNRLDGLAPMEGVLIVATTNHPERLDEAVTNRPSRFDRIFVFGNPAAPERRAYLQKQFGPAFIERLVAGSEGMSFAQLKEAWITACLEAVHAGRIHPDPEAAIGAFDRLRGQREARLGEWPSDRPVGFQPSILSQRSEARSESSL